MATYAAAAAAAAGAAAAAPAAAPTMPAAGGRYSHYVCVLDFEATCEAGVRLPDQEIIQFPSVLLGVRADGRGGVLVDTLAELDQFLRPTARPVLSAFCTSLTGITQAQVDAGVPFRDALARHGAWLWAEVHRADAGAAPPTPLPTPAAQHAELAARVTMVTCGDWDLKTMLPGQAGRERVPVPAYLTAWHNIKVGYTAITGGRVKEMPEMLGALGLRLTGRHHNGLDDCRNIARCATVLMTRTRATGPHRPR